MKKIVTLLALASTLLTIPKTTFAQCNGADVLISNIVIGSAGLVYTYSYNWNYVNGNASILVVLKCDGVVVAQGVCNDNLKARSNSNTTVTFPESGSVTYPAVCTGLKEIEFRIHASPNCGGTYCLHPPLTPLPVDFRSFIAVRKNSSVNLEWVTASESNNAGFAVESNSTGAWVQIDLVPSNAQNGNSTTDLRYTYTDINQNKGITQYRVKQIDIDGKSKYSTVRAVKGLGQNDIKVFPNPSQDGMINVVFDDNQIYNVQVVDMAGRAVSSQMASNSTTIKITGHGFFTLRIVSPTGETTINSVFVK